MFPALKQNIGGYEFKSDREVETVVTRWLVTQDTDLLTAENRKPRPTIR